MSSYPNAVVALSTSRANTDQQAATHASDHNALAAETMAIETELGLTPKDVYPDVAARLSILELLQFNVRTGATYTIVLGDRSKVISCIAAGGTTVTIPPSSAVAFPIGTQIMVRQGPSAGTVTIAPGAGVTLESRGSLVSLAGACAYATLIKVGTDTWDLVGDLA